MNEHQVEFEKWYWNCADVIKVFSDKYGKYLLTDDRKRLLDNYKKYKEAVKDASIRTA